MIIVQKFGGTSLSTAHQQEAISKKISKEINNNSDKKIVIVVSAMGRKGEPYATDTLLSLIGHNKDTSLDSKIYW